LNAREQSENHDPDGLNNTSEKLNKKEFKPSTKYQECDKVLGK
jgi:hypothetical protein